MCTTGCLEHWYTPDLQRDFPQNSRCPHSVLSRNFQSFPPQHQTHVKAANVHRQNGTAHQPACENTIPHEIIWHFSYIPPLNLILSIHVSVHLHIGLAHLHIYLFQYLFLPLLMAALYTSMASRAARPVWTKRIYIFSWKILFSTKQKAAGLLWTLTAFWGSPEHCRYLIRWPQDEDHCPGSWQ